MTILEQQWNNSHTVTCTKTDDEIRSQFKELIKISKELDSLKEKAKEEIKDTIIEYFPNVSEEYINIFAENAMNIVCKVSYDDAFYYAPTIPIKLLKPEQLSAMNVIYEECSDFDSTEDILYKILNNGENNEN